MDRDCILRRILDFRLHVFTNDKEKCQINTHKSPIFDILSVAITYGLFELIKDMTLKGTKIMSKGDGRI